MNNALMAFGQFVFALNTAPYQQLQHEQAWRHPGAARVLSRPAHQFLGPDEETITLSGVLVPELTGGDTALKTLEDMAARGNPEPLVEGGTGDLLGQFVIERLARTRSQFMSQGEARKIEFQLVLKRVDDDRATARRTGKAA